LSSDRTQIGLLECGRVEATDPMKRVSSPLADPHDVSCDAVEPDADTSLLADVRWAYTSGRYAALEYPFALRTSDRKLGLYLSTLFEPFETEGEVGDATMYSLVYLVGDDSLPYRLFAGTRCLASISNPARLLEMFLWHVNQSVLRASRKRLLIHASVASWNGTALLFPAQMESGKSTLVAGLVERGFDYLTDEAAAIEPDTLRVVPFPRAISLDRGSWGVLSHLRPNLGAAIEPYGREQWQIPPSAIRPNSVAAPCRPGFVIAPRYIAGASSALEPMRRVEAARALGDNAFNLRDFGSGGLRTVADVARQSRCYRLRIGDLDTACRLLLDLVGMRGDASLEGGA
jgi:hypothetical protein